MDLGSTTITTNSDGTFKFALRYKVWGEIRYSSGTTNTKYTFTGQYSFAGEFGLLDFKSRYYDPSIGRFAAPDSVIPEQSQGVQAWDRYAYSNNSPVVYNDPSGHCVYGATANSTGINWAAACSSIGNYAYQVAAKAYYSVVSSASGFASGYTNAAAGYYGSVYSYVPPAAAAFFSNTASPSVPQTSDGGETGNPGVPPAPENIPEIPEGATEEDLASIISDDYDSAEFRYALHESSGQVYWQYKFRWSNGVVVRIHQGLEPWRRNSDVVANVGYEVPPGSAVPFMTDLGITEYVVYTQRHITINTSLELLIKLFGFGY